MSFADDGTVTFDDVPFDVQINQVFFKGAVFSSIEEQLEYARNILRQQQSANSERLNVLQQAFIDFEEQDELVQLWEEFTTQGFGELDADRVFRILLEGSNIDTSVREIFKNLFEVVESDGRKVLQLNTGVYSMLADSSSRTKLIGDITENPASIFEDLEFDLETFYELANDGTEYRYALEDFPKLIRLAELFNNV